MSVGCKPLHLRRASKHNFRFVSPPELLGPNRKGRRGSEWPKATCAVAFPSPNRCIHEAAGSSGDRSSSLPLGRTGFDLLAAQRLRYADLPE
jgi:hypothetical protein